MVSHFAAGITLITLIACFFIPESPVYLINIDQTEQARKSLSILKRQRKLLRKFLFVLKNLLL
jgi:hypothetical protein